jgi:hypothetical protein
MNTEDLCVNPCAEALGSIGIFQRLSYAERQKLASLCHFHRYPADREIISWILFELVMTSFASLSTPVTLSRSTVTFFCRLRMPRIGHAMSDGASPAVATWYSSGWKRW